MELEHESVHRWKTARVRELLDERFEKDKKSVVSLSDRKKKKQRGYS